MTVRSMTGFARVDGSAQGWRWTWEVRSVNGKGLDLRLRLPQGFDAVEAAVRERATKRLSRGNCSATLSVEQDTMPPRYVINEAVLASLIEAMETVSNRFDVAPARLDGLLALRGVIEVEDKAGDPESRSAIEAEIVSSFDLALERLIAARAQEGRALAAILTQHLDAVDRLRAAAEAHPARRPEAIRARLSEQVRLLTDATSALDPQRLHQEAVLLATRADIREELDRLSAHLGQARQLLTDPAPVGRRLDFLSQEFNREVNTLCSKSNDIGLTAIGLDLKAIVDQIREQIQNVE
jgi:uncharacterized protein (TIGR00255 family)